MLKDIFKDYFYLGTALASAQIYGKDPLALEIMKKHFNSVTSENEMKWSCLQEKQGIYDFRAADRFVDLARKNGMFIVGHALAWYHQTPNWVFRDEAGKLKDRDTVLEYMREYIHTVVAHYRGRVHGWDAVNEALEDNGELRECDWFKILGPEYIEKAFEFAHQADPQAELYYNDYSLVFPAKRDGTVRLVRGLLDKGLPVHGIGMQGHWSLDFPEKIDAIEQSILAFAKLGVKVMVTEMDVSVLPFPDASRGADISLNFELKDGDNPYPNGLPADMQEKLAKRYGDCFKIFYKHRDKISRVTLWGIYDGQSWLNDWPIKGRTNYPLLFDREYKEKPAFYAVMKCMS